MRDTVLGICFGVFVAMKVVGCAWSWWWLLMPIVPVLAELFQLLVRNGVIR